MADLPANQTVDFVNGLINALNSGGVKAAEAFITALNPALLGNPLVAFFLDKGVEWLDEFVKELAVNSADALVFDLQTNGEKSDVYRAGQTLIFAKASGNADAIQRAKTELTAAWGNLIHFDGVASH